MALQSDIVVLMLPRLRKSRTLSLRFVFGSARTSTLAFTVDRQRLIVNAVSAKITFVSDVRTDC